MLLLLGFALAVAQDNTARQLLHDAVILEGVYGDLEAAVVRYRRLVQNRGMDDATRSDALVFLARTQYDLGQIDEARKTLVNGYASGGCDACREMLQQLVIDEQSVKQLPAVWDFRNSDPGFFHPLDLQDQGSIKLVTLPDESAALRWETVSQVRRNDRLVMGFNRPNPPPGQIMLAITSVGSGASVLLSAEDEFGHRHRMRQSVPLPQGELVQHTVSLSELLPITPNDPPLEPGRLTRLTLEVVDPSRTPNSLYLHRVEIRP